MGVLRKVLERLNDAECIFCGKEKYLNFMKEQDYSYA